MLPFSLMIGSLGCCLFSAPDEGRGPKAPSREFFRITVLDRETRRGIPGVELRTSDSRVFYTDSAGVIAFGEPDLLGKAVYFSVNTFGYTFPKNSMGLPSAVLKTGAGKSAEILMDRVNLSERLYRVTGSGIYRDSMLLGDKVPATQDDADVVATGMDSVQAVAYKGKMFWLWGDTNISIASHGNYRTTCATSDLPGKGLDPDIGVNLSFFRSKDYPYLKSMAGDAGDVVWLSALRVAREKDGRERLFANYVKVMGAGSMAPRERGIVEYDDSAEMFRSVAQYALDAPILPSPVPSGPCLRVNEKGREYIYYSGPFFPAIRSRADAKSQLDLSKYEAFTCLKEGSRADGSPEQLDRDASGRLRWGWKRDTSPLNDRDFRKLEESGYIKDDERWYRLTDVETSQTVRMQNGSVYWNAWRKRWVAIRSEQRGASHLGEIWYFEGDTPLGPWIYGRKVVSHAMGEKGVDPVTHRSIARDTYSFYNPTQHPEFDKDGGRVIYFEGTYTTAFSGASSPTPGYDYNQIMYRLSLDDPRLRLPVPIYRIKAGEKEIVYGTKERLEKGGVAEEVAFYAPDQQRENTVAVYRAPAGKKGQGERLALSGSSKGNIAFYAVAPDVDIPSTSSASYTVNLYEFRKADGAVRYSTQESIEGVDGQDFVRSEKPICRVWPKPIDFNPYAVE